MATKKRPAKKTPAKKTPAKKTPAKKAPANKTRARKAPAKKAPAKNTSTKDAAAKKAPSMSARSRGVTVDAYVEGLPREQALIARRLDEIVTAEVGRAASIKWGQPVWEAGGPVAYLRGGARHVTLGFWRGVELGDPDGRLAGEGTRMRHLRIASSRDLDEGTIRRLVREAVALNGTRGDPTRSG